MGSGEGSAANSKNQTVTIGSYTYTVTSADLKMEQQAFQAGEGVSAGVEHL